MPAARDALISSRAVLRGRGGGEVFQNCSFAKRLHVAHMCNHGWWRLAAVGGWRLMVGGDGQRFAVGGWWWLAVGGGWRLVVPGP